MGITQKKEQNTAKVWQQEFNNISVGVTYNSLQKKSVFMKFPNKSYLAVLLKMWCDIGHYEKSALQDTGRFLAEHKYVQPS